MTTVNALSGVALPAEPSASGALVPESYVNRMVPSEYPPAGQGFKAWTFDPVAIGGSWIGSVASTINLVRIFVPKAITVTTMGCLVQQAATQAGTGFCGMGIYSDGTSMPLLRATSSNTTTWQSVGYKTLALTASLAMTPGVYWLAMLWVGSASAGVRPTIAASVTTAPAGSFTIGGLRVAQFSSATLANPLTKASLSANVNGAMWMEIH